MSEEVTTQDDNNMPYLDFDGHAHRLTCLEPDENLVQSLPVFSDVFATLPRSDWREIDQRHYNIPVLDQQSTGACGAFCSVAGQMFCIKKSRRELVELNPYWLYALVNGGQDAGSDIVTNLKRLQDTGCCLKNDVPYRLLYQNQLPRALYPKASRWRVEYAYVCRSYDDICSAITRGFFVPFGIFVGDNFTRVSSDYVCPLPAGGGGGHGILGHSLKKHPRYGWTIMFRNSWGRRFGLNGDAYVHEGHFNRLLGAYALQTVIDDPQDTDPTDDVPVAG